MCAIELLAASIWEEFPAMPLLKKLFNRGGRGGKTVWEYGSVGVKARLRSSQLTGPFIRVHVCSFAANRFS
jgi:hypothetical protein